MIYRENGATPHASRQLGPAVATNTPGRLPLTAARAKSVAASLLTGKRPNQGRAGLRDITNTPAAAPAVGKKLERGAQSTNATAKKPRSGKLFIYNAGNDTVDIPVDTTESEPSNDSILDFEIEYMPPKETKGSVAERDHSLVELLPKLRIDGARLPSRTFVDLSDCKEAVFAPELEALPELVKPPSNDINVQPLEFWADALSNDCFGDLLSSDFYLI